MSRVNYNLTSLKKLTNEELENVFSEKTKPTLEMVLKKLGRRNVKKSKGLKNKK